MSKNKFGIVYKLFALAVVGVLLLGVLYKFRHRIEHFHPHLRFRTLESISISPSPLILPKGASRKVFAIAHYRDGSHGELVSGVTWTSSNPQVLSIDAEGIATAASQGAANLRATLQQHTSAPVTVMVDASAAVALAISPADGTVIVKGESQFRVLATSSDGQVEDVTRRVQWTSSAPAIVEVTPAGLARGRAQGRSTIVAQLTTPLGTIQTATGLSVVATANALGGVYSYRYDDRGTGQNRFETLLKPQNVSSRTFGKLFATPVDGYVYAQPLYVANVAVAGKGTHNVVYVATENNTILAIDADSGTVLFHTNLGPAVPKDQLVCPDMGPQTGITGTPVIDPATQTLYVAAKTFQNGRQFFTLHALDITSGQEKSGSPVLIAATFPRTGTKDHDATAIFDPAPQLQRPGLVLANGQLIVAFGSFCDQGNFHGWVFRYDAASLDMTGVFLTTPNGYHGGVWQAGAPPVVDPQGFLYAITGDGEFDAYDGGTDYGDTILKLQISPGDPLLPMDYFSPFDQNEMSIDNLDLGASGPLVLPDQPGLYPHLLLGAAKASSLYLINRDGMGHFQSSSNSQIVQYIPRATQTKIHVSPAYWRNATSEWVYVSGVEGPLTAFSLSQGRLSSTPVSQTSTIFGYPGATPIISSNGDSGGIVWALENYSGVLHAYSATDLAHELYNAKEAPNGRDAAERGVQFYTPMVANGKVYFGTRTHLYAYGLLSKSQSN
jgi:outer membrane protein assembly factor BamB